MKKAVTSSEICIVDYVPTARLAQPPVNTAVPADSQSLFKAFAVSFAVGIYGNYNKRVRSKPCGDILRRNNFKPFAELTLLFRLAVGKADRINTCVIQILQKRYTCAACAVKNNLIYHIPKIRFHFFYAYFNFRSYFVKFLINTINTVHYSSPSRINFIVSATLSASIP